MKPVARVKSPGEGGKLRTKEGNNFFVNKKHTIKWASLVFFLNPGKKTENFSTWYKECRWNGAAPCPPPGYKHVNNDFHCAVIESTYTFE